MSTDFTTGNNQEISTHDLYLMTADRISKILGVDRSKLFDFYKENGKCSGSAEWGYYDRYTETVNSNAYTENRLDDLIILSAAANKSIMLNKDPGTIEDRKAFIKSECSSLISAGMINDFELTGYFPHLDMPDQINSIVIDGEIKCVEDTTEGSPFGRVHAKIGYTDSCGVGTVEPVPYYPLDMSIDNLFEKDTLEDTMYSLTGVQYHWEIENPENVVIDEATSSMMANHFNAATLSSATANSIRISLTYTEN